MRLWSLHPRYLDSKGLVALWREGLLAQKVLQGNSSGYRNHPQLKRFRQTANPLGAIATYLRAVADEADTRDYHFNRSKIVRNRYAGSIAVTSGQLRYEVEHLLRKLAQRDPKKEQALLRARSVELHPSFHLIKGGIAEWEVLTDPVEPR
jgi:hypothetical protein